MATPVTVDLIPKKRSRKALVTAEIRKLAGNLYVAMSFLPLALFLALYGILYFYNIQLRGGVDKVSDEIIQIQTQFNADKKEEMEMFSARLDVLEFLLGNHAYTSRIFRTVENATHPRVMFDSLNFNEEGGVLVLRGRTENYRTLGEQIIALNQNKNISAVELTNVSLELGGEVTFSVSFKVKEDVYK